LIPKSLLCEALSFAPAVITLIDAEFVCHGFRLAAISLAFLRIACNMLGTRIAAVTTTGALASSPTTSPPDNKYRLRVAENPDCETKVAP